MPWAIGCPGLTTQSRSRSPAHQGSYVRQILADVRVSEFLSPKQALVTLHPGDPLTTVIDRLSGVSFSVLPVVDGDCGLLGVVNLEEVHLAAQQPFLKPLVLAEDLMRSDIRPLTPEDTLDRALELFVENDLLALPVVDDLQTRRVIAMVRRFDVANDTAEARRTAAREPDRFEQEKADFHQHVREAYLRRAAANPQRIRIIDGNRSIDEVRQQLRGILASFL